MKKALAVIAFFILGSGVLAQTMTFATDTAIDTLSQKLDATKADVDKFKNVWDKARLETTLYEARSKRAYQRWVKASKTARAKAQAARDKADLELQLSVEHRKLAFSQWQAAQLRQASQEEQLKALSQDQDTKAIQDKIKELEGKLDISVHPSLTP